MSVYSVFKKIAFYSSDESMQIITVQLTTPSRLYKPKAVERRDSEN